MSTAPRVLQVVLRLDPGGTERLVIELAKRLHSEMPMAVCCLDDPGAWAHELTERGIVVTALQRGPGFQPKLGRRVLAAARQHGASVLHAHHYSPYIYSCLAKVSRPSLRVLFTEHGRLSDAPPSGKRRFANQIFRRFSRDVFAVSEDVKAHLVGEGFARSQVGVIYNGVDVAPLPAQGTRADIRARLDVVDDEFMIGTIARLDPVKDLGVLLRATASLVREIRVVVVVIGDGPERAALEALSRELGIAAQVRFLGQRNDARDWLAGCDAYVNSSISEGVSLTILEAMAAGLPVVATRVGGTPEVVDESCGRLVPSREPETLSSVLRELAKSADLRQQLGAAARSRLEARFTLTRMISEYAQVYRSAIES